MAETDILNPNTGYDGIIGDNPNPSYGFERRTNANSLLSRSRLGSWYQRDNANSGYAFPMSYLNRPYSTMLRLKHFYEIGKNGYFTYIDYDGGGRHHVGRFTSEPNWAQTSNGKYSVQNLIFEEIPQARMQSYPNDFYRWSKTINVVDDFLRITTALRGAWTLQQIPNVGEALTIPASYELLYAKNTADNTTFLTEFAQVQYVGWGFNMTIRTDPQFMSCGVYVDGQLLVQLDLQQGTVLAGTLPVGYTIPGSPAPLAAPQVVTNVGSVFVLASQMPLDQHRVKLVPIAASYPQSGPFGQTFHIPCTAFAFPAITVIV